MTYCPDDSPIGDAEWLGIGVNGYWEYSAPYTVLRISALKGETVEIKYKDQTFSGEIPGGFTVFARKGSAIAKAQEETIDDDSITVRKEEFNEAAPYCRFKKVDGRWNLEEIADGLNYQC